MKKFVISILILVLIGAEANACGLFGRLFGGRFCRFSSVYVCRPAYQPIVNQPPTISPTTIQPKVSGVIPQEKKQSPIVNEKIGTEKKKAVPSFSELPV